MILTKFYSMSTKLIIKISLIVLIPTVILLYYFIIQEHQNTFQIYQEELGKLQHKLYLKLKQEGAKVLNVPFVKQKPWYCSEASASMVLKYYGYNISQDDVHNAGYENFETMLPFLNKYIKCKYATLTPQDLKKQIDQGKPVIIRIVIGEYLHTVVVVGYKENYFYIHDPAKGPYVKVSTKELLAVWKPNHCKAIIILQPPPLHINNNN